MTLDQLLKDLASTYRQFGNIHVYVETDTVIEEVKRADADIFNVTDEIVLVLETVSVPEETPDDPASVRADNASNNNNARQRRSSTKGRVTPAKVKAQAQA